MASKPIFPNECLELIFGHLKGEKLLKYTSVCPTWNYVIGSTRECMNGITLKFGFHLKYERKILLEGHRKYYSLEPMVTVTEKMVDLLEKDGRAWQKVCVLKGFETWQVFYDFLQLIQGSVQELTVHEEVSNKAVRSHFNIIDLQFP